MTPTLDPKAGQGHFKNPDTIESRMKIELRGIGIPPRPTILQKIEQEVAKNEPDFLRLAATIGADVGLSAALIKTANSPFFGIGKKVRSIQEAMLLLGLKLIVQTVAGLSLQNTFKHVPNMERFWDASASIARVSSWLARQLGTNCRIRPEDAYTFALFRDCGIPVLMIPFPEYRAILGKANSENKKSFTDIEDELLSINHAIVGSELTEDWLLPEDICQAIRAHHDRSVLEANPENPVSPSACKLIAISHLAEHLIQISTGLTQTNEWAKMGAASLATLSLSPEDVVELTAGCQAAIAAE